MKNSSKNKGAFSHINAVLFDFDGTLADTNGLIVDSWKYTALTLAGRSISDEEVRQTFGELLYDSIRRIIPEADTNEAIDVYRNYQRDIFLKKLRLFDGAEEVLKTLKKEGYKNALVTSRLRGSTERGLAHFGIDCLFDAVLTASDMDKFKPDPAPLYLTLEQIGCKPEEAIYVGDTIHDIEAGRAAGVYTVLVDWSFALPPRERAGAPAPDLVIGKLTDILTLLGIE